MGFFSDGRQMLHDMYGVSTEKITYMSGGVTVAENIEAKVAVKRFKKYDGEFPVYIHAQRFIVKREDLGGVVPKQKDEIILGDLRFRVGNPDGEPWSFHGGDYKEISIYTQYLGPKP